MKTKRHFIYTEVETKYSRTYGGRDYVLGIMEIKKKGDLVHLGHTNKRCSRGHMGEESEAWNWIYHNALTPRQRTQWRKEAGITNKTPYSVYFNFTAARALGYVLNQVGKLG